MKPPKTPDIKDYIPQDIPVIGPVEDSHLGLSVPEIIFTHGDKKKVLPFIPHIITKMLRSIYQVKRSYKSLEENRTLDKKELTPEIKEGLEKLVMELGVSQIGYTKVPRNFIFSNKVLLYDVAIVLTMAMRKSELKQAPSVATSKEVWRAYAELGSIVNRISAYLRDQGYAAQAGPALGGEVNYCLLAQKAGLGQIGHHGLLISKDCGPSQRIAAVFTNITNLVPTDNAEHHWITEFCENCRRCERTCPSRAIYHEKKSFKDGSIECIDFRRCAISFSESLGCSVCIKECTFFNGDYHKIKDSFYKNR